MKVLLASHDDADYLTACLWDGFQELLGADNVYDAGDNRYFHNTYHVGSSHAPCHQICGTRYGRFMNDEGDFDLLILNACFRAQYDWHWPWRLRGRLKSGGKVVFVEGGDDAHDVNDPAVQSSPPFVVDAVFRREMDPTYGYPYACDHLDFAAPARWVEEALSRLGQPRDIDIYYAGGPSHPVRWQMMRHLFLTERPFTFVVARQEKTFNFTVEENKKLLLRSQLALCPPGGSDCSSTMRLFEAMGYGAIPVCVGHSPRVQDPAWPVMWCPRVEDLPAFLDTILEMGVSETQREKYLRYTLAHHTTRARAKRILDKVGL